MQILIGAIRYTLVEVDEIYGPEGRLVGECDPVTCRIKIDEAANPQIKTVTLWHEILHGLLFNAGIPSAAHNEAHIDALAYGLVQVLTDNPHLIPPR